jgi:glycosyltransferase involved in cell wall biosynthesis
LPESKILINPILVSEQSHKSVNQQAYEVAKTKIEATLKNKRLLVYSGSFGEKDGIFYLIEAFAEVVKKYPDTVFVMTGKSETQAFKDKMQASIQQHNLQEKIILPGFVNSEELLCYNSMADILFVCRSNSPYANHGFPWKLGEYCMTGKPIIATRVSDIDNYFTDNEDLFIVAPNNPNAIAEKVNYIFSDYDTAMQVAKKGRTKALEVFGYTEKGKELVTFIKSNQKK